MQYNVDQLQIVVSSRMEKPDETNKLALFRINADSINNNCQLDVDSRITDMGWVSSFLSIFFCPKITSRAQWQKVTKVIYDR